MNSTIFNEILQEFDRKMNRLNKKACLIIDNAPSHKCMIDLKSTELIFLPPKTTSHIQPLIWELLQTSKAFIEKS